MTCQYRTDGSLFCVPLPPMPCGECGRDCKYPLYSDCPAQIRPPREACWRPECETRCARETERLRLFPWPEVTR